MNKNRPNKTRRHLLSLLPAALLTPINSLLAKISWDGTPRLMQGPMVGWVDENCVNIWARASGENSLQVEYWPENGSRTESKVTAPIRPSLEDDLTVVLRIADLEPSTRYRYRVLVDGKVDEYMERHGDLLVATAPSAETAETFSIAFGSCARVQQKPIQAIWHAVADSDPDLFFWLGDNIYADSTNPDIMAEVYRHQRNVPSFRPVMQSVPQLAIWDDHDYGLNDHDRRNPVKDHALRVFKNYWANPSYGLPDSEGVFFKYSYGGIDCFFLDDRYYRDPFDSPNSAEKTMLGEAQKQWLKEGLLASKSPFKLIVIGNGWNDAKGHPSESWASFTHEREEIFRFIADNGVSGVLLLSGDTHVGELNCIPRSDDGSYDLYEFVSSPLAQDPSQSWLNYLPILRMRQVYFRGSNFGLLRFDLRDDDPSVTFTLHDEQGASIWDDFTLRASQLSGNQMSWDELIDDRSRERFERSEQGGSYYARPNRNPQISPSNAESQ